MKAWLDAFYFPRRDLYSIYRDEAVTNANAGKPAFGLLPLGEGNSDP